MKRIQYQFKILSLIFILAVFADTIYAQNVSENDLKINVAGISNALGKLKLLEPVTYEYNTDKYKRLDLEKGKRYGFLADDFQTVFPEMVYSRHFSQISPKHFQRDLIVKKMDTQSLIPVLVASIRELEAEIEKLKKELNDMKKTNNSN